MAVKHEYIEKAQRINFDRLTKLVDERIAALRLYVDNIDKADGPRWVHDAICRDLVMPCIYTLAGFLESVKIDGGELVPQERPAASPDGEMSG